MRATPYGAVIVILIGAMALIGCATSGFVDTSADAPAPIPTAGCIYSDTEEIDVPGCVTIDGEQSMQQNETYRDRKVPSPADQVILDQAWLSAEAALQAITEPIPTADQVRDALTAEGLTSVEAVGSPATGVGFWAQVEMNGCIFGEITPETGLTIETGGFIADGGCHALSGH